MVGGNNAPQIFCLPPKKKYQKKRKSHFELKCLVNEGDLIKGRNLKGLGTHIAVFFSFFSALQHRGAKTPTLSHQLKKHTHTN